MADDSSGEIIIAGAGLAGACAALWLSRTHETLVLEAKAAASGASATAAGIVSPLMSRRARPVWRMHEAEDALQELLELAGAHGLFDQHGVLKPAADLEQAEAFQRAAREMPSHAAWFGNAETETRYAPVHAPYGALFVVQGGSVEIPRLVGACFAAAERNGATLRSGARLHRWIEEAGGVRVEVEEQDGQARTYHAKRLILCLGAGYEDVPHLGNLRLHPVKGQTVSVRAPFPTNNMPPIVGSGFVIPRGRHLLLGSTFQHAFDTPEPEAERTREILARIATLLPSVHGARAVEEWAGIRITVPGIRLPMIGPIPGHERVWIFTGLGSKGLLMAPLLARELDDYLMRPESIPRELRVRGKGEG